MPLWIVSEPRAMATGSRLSTVMLWVLHRNSVRFLAKLELDPIAPGSDAMKIALKYGIAVTLVIAIWVAVKHFVLHLQGPSAQFADVGIFNFGAIVGLMLGIKEKRLANGNKLTVGDGFMTGLGIAITYALLTSLYFVFLLAVVGPGMMQQEGETSYVKAFAGVSIGFFLFGAIFSAVIALVLRQ